MKTSYLRLIYIFTIIIMTANVWAAAPRELFNAQLEAAKKAVTELSPHEVMKMIIDKKEFTLIDVREPNEIESGQIEAPKTMNTPRGLIDIIASTGALTPDATYVLYCKKGSRGLLAAATLRSLGFKNVYNIKDGIHAWMEAGYPITNSLGTFKTVPYDLTGCGK